MLKSLFESIKFQTNQVNIKFTYKNINSSFPEEKKNCYYVTVIGTHLFIITIVRI